jgi:hypothetical protein
MNPDQKDNYWEHDPANEPEAPANEPISSDVSDDEPAANPLLPSEDTPVSWSAHEYITFDKSPLWYVIFAVVVLGFISIDVFLLQSWTFSAVVIVMAITVIVFARRPARTIEYTLSGKQGLYVGERLYNYADFKAFGIIKDGEHHSIMLIPIKRFSPGVTVYFPEEAGEKIVDILGKRLPMETLKLDVIDVIVRQLRL